MKIIKKTIVKNICGIEANISIESLTNILIEIFEVDFNLVEIIDELNENEAYEGDEFFISIHDQNHLKYSSTTRWASENGYKILEKVFNEEFIYMESERFYLDIENDFFKTSFVESIIYSSGKEIFKITTKGHYETKMNELKDENFMNTEDIKVFDKYSIDENVEKNYDANYCFYFMKKNNFNQDKWWLGWKSENDDFE